MSSLKLTKSAVDSGRSTAHDAEIRDTIVPGFFCKVTPAGRKTSCSLHAGSFLDARRNIVLVGGTVGPWGSPRALRVGWAHGQDASRHRDHRRVVRAGARGRYFDTVDLVNRPEEETRVGKAGHLAAQLSRLELVVLDELGYLPFARSGGQLLFHLVSKCLANRPRPSSPPTSRMANGPPSLGRQDDDRAPSQDPSGVSPITATSSRPATTAGGSKLAPDHPRAVAERRRAAWMRNSAQRRPATAIRHPWGVKFRRRLTDGARGEDVPGTQAPDLDGLAPASVTYVPPPRIQSRLLLVPMAVVELLVGRLVLQLAFPRRTPLPDLGPSTVRLMPRKIAVVCDVPVEPLIPSKTLFSPTREYDPARQAAAKTERTIGETNSGS